MRSVNDFGYIMPLCPGEYKNLSRWVKQERDCKMGFRQQVSACLELAHSFHHLHANGWSYQDISFGNIFIHPETGRVLICDNDNVAAHGLSVGNVMGTPRFIAPEIVLGKKRPDAYTDLFSLAILMFYILMVAHPLEGAKEAMIKCLDIPAMLRLYGLDPIFIFDPDNSDNRPVPGLHDNAIISWNVYPAYIKELFIRSFTKGIHDPQNGRVRESEWMANFSRLLDSIIYCPHCGGENFCKQEGRFQMCSCPGCNRLIPIPARLDIGARVVMLNYDSKLYRGHVNADDAFNYRDVVGEVAQNPGKIGLWGIRNLTDTVWRCRTPDGNVTGAPSGKTVALRRGMEIDFGDSTGEIK